MMDVSNSESQKKDHEEELSILIFQIILELYFKYGTIILKVIHFCHCVATANYLPQQQELSNTWSDNVVLQGIHTTLESSRKL